MIHNINCPKSKSCAVMHSDGVCPDSLKPCTCNNPNAAGGVGFGGVSPNVFKKLQDQSAQKTDYERGYNAGFVDGFKKGESSRPPNPQLTTTC